MGNLPYTFTVMSQEREGFFSLLRSAKGYHWPLDVHWCNDRPGNYDGFLAAKHLTIANALYKAQQKGHKKFLYLDGWDTIFNAPPPAIESPFDSNIVYFSGEQRCYPEPKYAEFFFKAGHFPYPNSGVIWGDIEYYLNHYPNVVGHDQLQWIRYMVTHPVTFIIDENAKVALNLLEVPQDHLGRGKDGELRFIPSASRPFVVHANGPSQLPPWMKYLG